MNKKYLLSCAFLLLPFLFSTGCSTTNNSLELQHRLTKDISSALPSAACSADFLKHSLLKFKWGQEKGTLMVVEKCSNGILTLDGLMPTGLELFQIIYNDKKVRYQEKVPMVHSLPIMEILFDSIAVRTPPKVLESSLPNHWTVKDNKNEMVIFDSDKNPIETFNWPKGKKGDMVRIFNHSFSYEIEIQDLPIN